MTSATSRRLPIALAGAGLTLTARALVSRALLLKIRRDVRALNGGDIRPLLFELRRRRGPALQRRRTSVGG